MNDSYYVLSLNILKALGGDTSIIYPDADAIWVEINKIYDHAGNRFDIVPLEKNITENGQYDYYPDGDADAFMPVNINVNVPQKYTDEQVFEIESNAIQQGYNQGYVEGEAEGKLTGREEGYTDGYNTGYGTGVTDGGNAQKAKLVDITIRENGVYTKDDGYKTVTVEIESGIPEEELQQMLQEAMDEGYQDGYAEGVDDGREDGIEEQKAKLTSTTIEQNGTFTSEDGWNKVIVDVPIDGGALDIAEELGYDDKTVNNMFNNYVVSQIAYTKSLETAYTKPTNGTLAGKYKDNTMMFCPNIDISSVTNFGNNTYNSSSSGNYGTFANCVNLVYIPLDFSSAKYLGSTFSNCGKLGGIKSFDASNVTNCASTFYACYSLTEVPFTKVPTSLTDSSRMFTGCSNLTHIPHIDTSKCTAVTHMYCGCKNLEGTIEMDLSSCTNQIATTSQSSTTINGQSLYLYPFNDCKKIDTIKLLNLNKNLTCLCRLFYGCGVKHVEMTWDDDWAPTDISSMFYSCSQLEGDIPNFDLSKVTTCGTAFYYCSKITSVPTQNYQSLSGNKTPESYYYCKSLQTFNGDINYPLLTASSYSTTQFSGCFYEVPCDIPNINLPLYNGTIYEIFKGYKGKQIGNLYCPKAYKIILGLTWGSITNLESIGEIQCDSATGIQFCTDYTANPINSLTHLGGFINYGMTSSASSITSSTYYSLSRFPNLTKESLLNVLNGLYDRASAGYSVLSIHFGEDHLSKLTDDEKAIATNKGWTLS